MKFTTLIKKESSRNLNFVLDKVFALLASFFSIFFAMSIVLELAHVVDGYVLIFLSAFICLFLLFNEWFKIKNLKQIFRGNYRSFITFSLCFILSVGLSGIGVYFWTNKSVEIINNNNIEKTQKLNEVNKDFLIKINDVQESNYESTDEYKSLINDVIFWQERIPVTLKERENITAQVIKIELKIESGRENYNIIKSNKIEQLNTVKGNEVEIINSQYSKTENKANRNNFVTYIFLTLILITEFAILILNKNLSDKEDELHQFVNGKDAKMFIIGSKLLSSLYLTINHKNNSVNINNAKYSVVNIDNVLEWEELKRLYNTYINLGILSDGEIINNVLTNKFLMEEGEAQKKYQVYFEKHFKL